MFIPSFERHVRKKPIVFSLPWYHQLGLFIAEQKFNASFRGCQLRSIPTLQINLFHKERWVTFKPIHHLCFIQNQITIRFIIIGFFFSDRLSPITIKVDNCCWKWSQWMSWRMAEYEWNPYRTSNSSKGITWWNDEVFWRFFTPFKFGWEVKWKAR